MEAERSESNGMYDLTRCGGVSAKAEHREQPLLQGAQVGQAGGGGKLPLALAAWIDDQRFADRR